MWDVYTSYEQLLAVHQQFPASVSPGCFIPGQCQLKQPLRSTKILLSML